MWKNLHQNHIVDKAVLEGRGLYPINFGQNFRFIALMVSRFSPIWNSNNNYSRSDNEQSRLKPCWSKNGSDRKP
jgi:hypothetical protein